MPEHGIDGSIEVERPYSQVSRFLTVLRSFKVMHTRQYA